MPVRIVTDSSCDLPADILEEFDIVQVPLRVNFGAETYADCVDLTPDDFQRKLLSSNTMPTTSPPAPQQFHAVLKPLVASGMEVVVITLSSALSGTYTNAQLAAGTIPGVTVIDSLLGSMGLGLLAIKAAKLAAQGADRQQLQTYIEAERRNIRVFLTMESVENIVRGGRLSLFKARAASNPGIKLIFTNNDLGQLEILERVRGRRGALERLVQLVADRQDWSQTVVGISHVASHPEVESLRRAIEENYHPARIVVREMGSTIGAYVGRGGLLVSV
ncbi:MAG: DegV family protein [Firmicutes bacterium]|nr:DegV family protein [Bacillota bacterium]